jgi:hypothetical protein
MYAECTPILVFIGLRYKPYDQFHSFPFPTEAKQIKRFAILFKSLVMRSFYKEAFNVTLTKPEDTLDIKLYIRNWKSFHCYRNILHVRTVLKFTHTHTHTRTHTHTHIDIKT